jgi:DNA polymerase III delta prime subunit
MDLKNIIWNEKYRPTMVDEVISKHTLTIKKYLENPSSIPNFLFYSKIGGTGKSSMAKAIVKDLGCDVLTLNASADRSIDNIRNKVKDFARSKSSNNIKKCVFMDEGEKLTKDASDALKNMIEEYATNTFYIFTTNNIDKINQPMQSRFICMEFTQPDKEQIFMFLKNICDKEEVVYDDVSLKTLVDKKYPSIRSMINYLQDCKMQDNAVGSIRSCDELFNDYWKLVVEQKFNELRKIIIEEGVDVEGFNYHIFYNIAPTLDLKKQVKLIQICAGLEKDFKFGCDKVMVFIAGLVNIFMVVRE